MIDFIMIKDDDGVVIIIWDVVVKLMNVLFLDGVVELNGLIDDVLVDDVVKGIVIILGKKDFVVGMDLNVIVGMKQGGVQVVFDGIMGLYYLLCKIEFVGMDFKIKKGGKLIVVVLFGLVFGIGLELLLVMYCIFVVENLKVKIGLFEIMVGIFFGGGGMIWLVCKLGVMVVVFFLLEGKFSDLVKVKFVGLIDEVVVDLLVVVCVWVLVVSDVDLVKLWDVKGYKMLGGEFYYLVGFMIFVGVLVMVYGKMLGVYFVVKVLFSVVYEGVMVFFDIVLKIEVCWFINVLMNLFLIVMICSLFINKEVLEKGVNCFEVFDQIVKKVGIFGVGMMGVGIVYVLVMVGIQVVLIDLVQELVDRGKFYFVDLLDKVILCWKFIDEKKVEVLVCIMVIIDYVVLEGCDLIVEVVFEDLKVKVEVIVKVEVVIFKDVIFVINILILLISDLVCVSSCFEQFIGIYFFLFVDKMLLVEIIKGKQIGFVVVVKVLDFVCQICKMFIVVNDVCFFYVNCCIIFYINEGICMVVEGVSLMLIENVVKMMGMLLGLL